MRELRDMAQAFAEVAEVCGYEDMTYLDVLDILASCGFVLARGEGAIAAYAAALRSDALRSEAR